MSVSNKTGHLRPKNPRQALLCFSPRSVKQAPPEQLQPLLPDAVDRGSVPKPAPSLPEEIWGQILDSLGNLALKTFRLVCREWLQIGTSRLYATFYLNSFEKCWSGLLAISKTPYAEFVKKIVWNPLVLMEECLDGVTWKSRYPNLLRGLNHWQILRFNEAFIAVYKARNSFLRSSSVESISEALGTLCNCHEVCLSDDYDFEMTCSDQYLRAGMQSNYDLLDRPHVWALSPRMWKETSETREALRSCSEVFRALQSCPSVTSMTIDFWIAHYLSIMDTLLPICVGPPNSNSRYENVTYLKLALKFCPSEWLDSANPSIQCALENIFGCTQCFPDLQVLVIEPSFVDPGKDYMQFCRQEQSYESSDGEIEYFSANWSDWSELVEALALPTCNASLLVDILADRYGQPASTYKAICAEFRPNFIQLPKLKLLRLCNLSVDGRSLLCWLCSQKQIIASQLTLGLHGTTVISGLRESFFRGALAALNVHLSSEAEAITCYFPASQEPQGIPHLSIFVSKGNRKPQEQYWTHDSYDVWSEGNQILDSISEHPLPRITYYRGAEILARPNDFAELISKHERLERDLSYCTYQVRLSNSRLVWEWADGFWQTTASGLEVGDSQTVPLMRLTISRYVPYSEDDGGYGYMHMLEVEAQTQPPLEEQAEEEEQQLLLMYETELLGLDLVDHEASQLRSMDLIEGANA